MTSTDEKPMDKKPPTSPEPEEKAESGSKNARESKEPGNSQTVLMVCIAMCSGFLGGLLQGIFVYVAAQQGVHEIKSVVTASVQSEALIKAAEYRVRASEIDQESVASGSNNSALAASYYIAAYDLYQQAENEIGMAMMADRAAFHSYYSEDPYSAVKYAVAAEELLENLGHEEKLLDVRRNLMIYQNKLDAVTTTEGE